VDTTTWKTCLNLHLDLVTRYNPSLLEDATGYGQIVANLEDVYGAYFDYWQDLLPPLTVPSPRPREIGRKLCNIGES
jgi:hypothetical protein